MLSFLKVFNSKKVAPYVFISVPVILVFSLLAYPMLEALRVSLFDYKLFSEDNSYVGLENYINLMHDRQFLNCISNTFVFTISYVVFGLLIGLLLAMIVFHLQGKIQDVVKSIYFLPVIVSMVPVAIAFKWLMRSPADGVLNYYLSTLGIGPILWLTSENWALASVIIVTLWKNAGFIMIIYLAGLLDIPKSYYEAAEIDGAGKWAVFHRITLPLLRNTTLFLMVTGFIGAFQAFTQVQVLTGGYGPNGSTSTLGYEIYMRGFDRFEMSSAAAMGFVMFIFILIATIFQLKYFGGEKEAA